MPGKLALRWYFGLIVFSLLGMAASAAFKLDAGPIPPIASALIILFGWLTILGPVSDELERRVAIRAMLVVLVLGAASEIVGIYTGFPFGRYAYTQAWQPTVTLPGGHAFPLLLPVAWGMIAGACTLLYCRFLTPTISIFLAALTATIYDIPMEVVLSSEGGYWQWLDPTFPIGPGLPPGVPLMNAVGWFAVTALASLSLHAHGIGRVRAAKHGGLVLLGFLVLLAGQYATKVLAPS